MSRKPKGRPLRYTKLLLCLFARFSLVVVVRLFSFGFLFVFKAHWLIGAGSVALLRAFVTTPIRQKQPAMLCRAYGASILVVEWAYPVCADLDTAQYRYQHYYALRLLFQIVNGLSLPFRAWCLVKNNPFKKPALSSGLDLLKFLGC